MNLLIVVAFPIFGGPHQQALELARPLEREGVALTVVVPPEGNAASRLRAGGVDVITVSLHRARATLRPSPHIALMRHLSREIAALRRVIRERAIDVVAVAGLVNPHAAIAGALEGKPVIWQLVDTRTPMAVRRLMMPLVVRLSDVIMSTGRIVAEVHPGAGKVGERLYPYFMPVDFEKFSAGSVDRKSARRSYGFGSEDLVLVSVGNLNPQKGHEYLLQAVDLLAREGHRAKALIVGASHETHVGYERSLYSLCKTRGLEIGRDVVFAGGLADVRPALGAADIFVLTSVPRSEGVPVAAEEAMGMQLPVVSTAVGGVSELVEHGVTGLLVRPLDTQALATAIVRLDDPATRLEMGARGRERAMGLCSAEECARIHVAACEKALEHRAARLNGRPESTRVWRRKLVTSRTRTP